MVNLYANMGTSPQDYLEAGSGKPAAASRSPFRWNRATAR